MEEILYRYRHPKQNLSAGKVDNPKEKGTIDNILKQMQ